MSVIVLLIVAGGVVAAGFLGAFAWAVQSGQYDDTHTPAVRMLLEDKTRQEDRKTGRQEDKKTGRREDGKTGRREDGNREDGNKPARRKGR